MLSFQTFEVFSMNQRDRVTELAQADFARAFKLARSIPDVRQRIQSLGRYVRYRKRDMDN